jgi:hypothetical protein
MVLQHGPGGRDMTTLSIPTGPDVPPGEPGARVIRASDRESLDPAEPWEVPATQADLEELSTKRFERLPHRPASLAEIPPGAAAALEPVVGEMPMEHVFVIPRAARSVGIERSDWVLSPTEVVAIGRDRIAVWIDEPAGPRVRAVIPFSDVVAVLDRSILLYGRLEIIGPEASLVVRYNTVGQPELRGLLLPLRRSFGRVPDALAEASGRDPGSLPHKWMSVLHSSDVRVRGREPMLVAAGDLDSQRPQLHDGVAVLTAAELVVATDPTPDARSAQYGVDLLIVPRALVTGMAGSGGRLGITVGATPHPVDVWIDAHPTLVADAVRLLGPLTGPRR